MPEDPDRRSDRGPLAFFDLDGTLFDRTAAFSSWARSFVAVHGLDPSVADFLITADRGGQAQRSEVFAPLSSRFGLDMSPAEVEIEYRIEYPKHFGPDPAVNDAVESLRGDGWTVYIVTNGPPSQIEKIESSGLNKIVDGWCISDVVGSAKPDRAIFDFAAAELGRPLEGWMVGDTPETDVLGGRRVGLSTIWISLGRPVPQTHDLIADVTVPTIFDAFTALRSSR
jgi:FMN phosphatase YigB (HAD superfamily)